MSDALPSRAAGLAWGRLAVAFSCAVLVGANPYLGVLLLSAVLVLLPPAVRWLPLAAVATLRLYLPFAVVWLAFVVGYLRGAWLLGYPVAPQPMLEQLAGEGTALPGFWLALAGIVLLAPFFEELLFRGYLFTALATVLPTWAVQLVTAILFGLVHGLDYALPIAVLALLFGYLRQRHRSLLPSMLAHAVHNGLTVTVTILWPGHIDLLYPH